MWSSISPAISPGARALERPGAWRHRTSPRLTIAPSSTSRASAPLRPLSPAENATSAPTCHTRMTSGWRRARGRIARRNLQGRPRRAPRGPSSGAASAAPRVAASPPSRRSAPRRPVRSPSGRARCAMTSQPAGPCAIRSRTQPCPMSPTHTASGTEWNHKHAPVVAGNRRRERRSRCGDARGKRGSLLDQEARVAELQRKRLRGRPIGESGPRSRTERDLSQTAARRHGLFNGDTGVASCPSRSIKVDVSVAISVLSAALFECFHRSMRRDFQCPNRGAAGRCGLLERHLFEFQHLDCLALPTRQRVQRLPERLGIAIAVTLWIRRIEGKGYVEVLDLDFVGGAPRIPPSAIGQSVSRAAASNHGMNGRCGS